MQGKFYFPHQFFSMRKILSTLVIVSLAMTPFAFAADDTAVPTSAPVPTSTTSAPTAPTTATTPTMNAAPSAAPSVGSSLGEYASVACSSNALFGSNSCDQCFEGGSVKVGDSLTGLFDNWTNNTPNALTAYKEEQKMPNMVKVGNTNWVSTPTDETKMWKYPVDVQWISTGTGGKSQYILAAASKVKFMEADIGAKYVLEKTDKKNGDTVGILRFPVVSHVVDITTGTEGAADTHYECVAYKLTASATPVTPTPTPEQMTETKTGPETLVLIVAAFFIAFGLMFSLRRRM